MRLLQKGTMRLAGFACSALALGGVLVLVLAATGHGATRVVASVPQNTQPPTISGSAQEGKTLRASRGSWANGPTAYAFRWLRCDRNGGSCAGISGASSRDYTLSSADVGNTLRVRVTASNSDGEADATSVPTAVVQAADADAPRRTASPTISGTAQQGQTLTASNGSWAGAQPITFSYAWLRCDGNGDNCSDITGATSNTYQLQAAEVGHTLRARVTAKNASGSSSATSVPTASVRKASAPGGAAISISEVTPPARLVIDRFTYTPNPLRSPATSLTVRFRVSDTEDHRVQGALVYVLGTPYGRFNVPPEAQTGGDGWVTFQLTPTRRLAGQLHPGGKFNFFVRARKPGDSLLAGISSRRLVQVNLSSP